MPLIQYKVWRPTDDVLQVVHQANEIIDELQQEGFGFAKDLVTPMANLTTPEELPDMREKRTTAYSLADQLERANTPVPFERAEPAEEEDPDAEDLEDPDAEDQDYGLGPVRGE